MNNCSPIGCSTVVLLLAWWTCIPGALAEARPARSTVSPDVRKEASVVAGLALPPLATVESRDQSGETWEASGAIAGGLPVARTDFRKHFGQQGWTLDKVVPLDSGREIRELCLWVKGTKRFVLMLWEASAGKSGFALGEIRQGQPGNKERVER